MTWRARLKREIRLVSRRYSVNEEVELIKSFRGHVHVVGNISATVADKDWELVLPDYVPSHWK